MPFRHFAHEDAAWRLHFATIIYHALPCIGRLVSWLHGRRYARLRGEDKYNIAMAVAGRAGYAAGHVNLHAIDYQPLL